MEKIFVLRTLFKEIWFKELGISVKISQKKNCFQSYKKYYKHKKKKCQNNVTNLMNIKMFRNKNYVLSNSERTLKQKAQQPGLKF